VITWQLSMRSARPEGLFNAVTFLDRDLTSYWGDAVRNDIDESQMGRMQSERCSELAPLRPQLGSRCALFGMAEEARHTSNVARRSPVKILSTTSPPPFRLRRLASIASTDL
jgi:hypothetical protein